MTVNNVGTKIKILTVVVAVIGCIACVILFFVGNSAYQEDKDYIEYATVNGGAYGYSVLEDAGNNALAGQSMMIYSGAVFVAIAIGALPMYAFGVLVENSQYNAVVANLLNDKLTKIEKELKDLSADSKNPKTNTPTNTSSV